MRMNIKNGKKHNQKIKFIEGGDFDFLGSVQKNEKNPNVRQKVV